MSKINPQKKYKYVYRSSITGKLVTEAYALANPSTTEKERVEIK